MANRVIVLFISACLFLFSACSSDDTEEVNWEWDDGSELPEIPVSAKPRILWVDASANFKYFANSKDNICLYLDKAKSAGFTELVVDVRPPSGDVLYKSNIATEVTELGGVKRTESWDYLEYFLQAGHERGLKVNVSMNTFVGGSSYHGGMVYRDQSKTQWLTKMYYSNGIISIMDDGKSHEKFFNPLLPEVQEFVLSIIAELAQNYSSLDGIILDRARFNSIESDFSDFTKGEFEKYIGKTVASFPKDIFTYGFSGKKNPGVYYKKWLEFRAKVIYDFFEKSRSTIKEINSNIRFGTYTGSWYSSYYNEGVNWASKKYDPSKYYDWASPDYKNYGYAGLLDLYMTGAYGKTLYGSTNEWTVEGAIMNAKKVIKGDIPVCGSLYGLNFENCPKDAEEATYIALTRGDGLMFFDIIYLIMYDQWNDVKRGIDRALATEKK